MSAARSIRPVAPARPGVRKAPEPSDSSSSRPSALADSDLDSPGRSASPPSAVSMPLLGNFGQRATARTILEPATASIAHEFFDAVMESRRALARFLPWAEYMGGTLDAYSYLHSSEMDWQAERAFRFVIRDRQDRRFLGIVSFENVVHFHRCADLGYWIRKSACGRGLVTEAAGSLLELFFSQHGFHRIRAFASTENESSLSVIRRLGFHEEGRHRQAEWCQGRWHDHIGFARLASDRLLSPPR